MTRARPNAEATPMITPINTSVCLLDHHVPDARRVRAEREAHAHFLRSLLHRIRHQTIDADRCEDQR